MRQPSSTAVKIAALLAALVIVAGSEVSRVAADECLAAPNGPAPKGQHWFYHLDRATQQKCWYLREPGAQAKAPAAPPLQHADDSAAPAPLPDSTAKPVVAPVASVDAAKGAEPSPPAPDPSARAVGPAAAPSALPSRHADENGALDVVRPGPIAPVAPAGPGPAASEPEAPAPALSAPATDPEPVRDTAILPSEPPPAQDTVQADVAPDGASPPMDADPVTTGAIARPDTIGARDTPPAGAVAPDSASTSTLAENIFVIALAAALAGVVSAIFVAVRRRKRVKLQASEIDLAAGDMFPRFGSKADRESGGWFRFERRRVRPRQTAPIETSLIPEQVAMSRPQASPRARRPLARARPYHIE